MRRVPPAADGLDPPAEVGLSEVDAEADSPGRRKGEPWAAGVPAALVPRRVSISLVPCCPGFKVLSVRMNIPRLQVRAREASVIRQSYASVAPLSRCLPAGQRNPLR